MLEARGGEQKGAGSEGGALVAVHEGARAGRHQVDLVAAVGGLRVDAAGGVDLDLEGPVAEQGGEALAPFGREGGEGVFERDGAGGHALR